MNRLLSTFVRPTCVSSSGWRSFATVRVPSCHSDSVLPSTTFHSMEGGEGLPRELAALRILMWVFALGAMILPFFVMNHNA